MSENKERKLFGGCLVGREREEKKNDRVRCFLLAPTKKLSPQNGEKTTEGRLIYL